MNNWNFTGNLGKNAELKTTQSGKNVCTFSVAVTSGYGDNQKTTWANCVVFGKRADGALKDHLVTGQKVAISGEVTLEKWNDAQGVEKSAVKVVVGTLDLIGGAQAGNTQAPQQVAPQQGYQQPAQAQATQQAPQQSPQQQVPQQQVQQQPQVNQVQPNPANSQPKPAQTSQDGFDDDIPF